MIERREIEQYYDEDEEMFLPDRYIKGTCPKCGEKDQYGDSCEKCGATYSSTEVIEPISVISNSKPIKKKTEHLFFKLSDYEKFLSNWLTDNRVQKEIKNKIKESIANVNLVNTKEKSRRTPADALKEVNHILSNEDLDKIKK